MSRVASIWETGGSSSAEGTAMAQLPPGGKFAPTERELLGYYLYNHIRRTLPRDHSSAIRWHDLYGKEEPWDMWERLQSGSEPGDAYAFTTLKKKDKSDGGKHRRTVRKVGKSDGSWHGEDTGIKFKLVRRARSPLEQDERWIGMRKRFIYWNPNPDSASEHGKWILHEFSMKKAGCREEESEVLCVIRNNGSPKGDAIVETARRSILAGRKRKLEDYITHFAARRRASDDTSDCSKRVCYSNPVPAPPQPQHPLPLPSAMVEFTNPTAPLAMMVPPPQPQPVVEEDDLETLDVISSIDFDFLDEGDFDWGDQGCSSTGADPQSVLEFPQCSSSDQDHKDYHTTTSTTSTAATTTTQDETNEPLYLLPPPPPTAADCSEPTAAANAVVEEDGKGKEPMVTADSEDGALAAASEDDAPVVVAVDDGTAEDDGGKGKQIVVVAADNYDDCRQAAELAAKGWMLQAWDVTAGSMGFSDLLDMPLSLDSLGYPLEGNGVSWEATPYVDQLWDFGIL